MSEIEDSTAHYEGQELPGVKQEEQPGACQGCKSILQPEMGREFQVEMATTEDTDNR